ncbi:MAG: PstA family ABC transporter permease [Phycisphaerales bacterium JB063]
MNTPASSLKNAPRRSKTARLRTEQTFKVVCLVALVVTFSVLVTLLASVAFAGFKYLDVGFLTGLPSRRPANAGIMPALMGTLWACLICALTAIPVGVATAILLEEYRPKSKLGRWLIDIVQLNITNLAGVPSIVYGVLGLTVFVYLFQTAADSAVSEPWSIGSPNSWFYLQLPMGRSVLAGGLTLALVIVPVIITAASEAIRAVPSSLKQASLALGATRWQTIRRVVLPKALPGIATGSILAMSRAIGEAAPVLMISGAVFLTFAPRNLMDKFTVMPLQIYNWVGKPQEEFHQVAATGIVVLLAVLLLFNGVAVFIRQRSQRMG